MKIFPTKQQFTSWPLTGKASYVGMWLGVIAILLTIIFYVLPKNQTEIKQNINGNNNVQTTVTGDNANVTIIYDRGVNGSNSPGAVVAEKNKTHSITQEAIVNASPESNIYQAGRDIVLQDKLANNLIISSITLEARLTNTIKEGAEIPPSEVMFIPMGDSHSYLIGPPGKTRIDFVSPVQFRLQNDNQLVVINRFTLASGSILHGRPIEVLSNYKVLSVPIVTVVYGKSLELIQLLEVSLFINGELAWYKAWEYNVPFQTGPRFGIPLDNLHNKIDQIKNNP